MSATLKNKVVVSHFSDTLLTGHLWLISPSLSDDRLSAPVVIGPGDEMRELLSRELDKDPIFVGLQHVGQVKITGAVDFPPPVLRSRDSMATLAPVTFQCEVTGPCEQDVLPDTVDIDAFWCDGVYLLDVSIRTAGEDEEQSSEGLMEIRRMAGAEADVRGLLSKLNGCDKQLRIGHAATIVPTGVQTGETDEFDGIFSVRDVVAVGEVTILQSVTQQPAPDSLRDHIRTQDRLVLASLLHYMSYPFQEQFDELCVDLQAWRAFHGAKPALQGTDRALLAGYFAKLVPLTNDVTHPLVRALQTALMGLYNDILDEDDIQNLLAVLRAAHLDALKQGHQLEDDPAEEPAEVQDDEELEEDKAPLFDPEPAKKQCEKWADDLLRAASEGRRQDLAQINDEILEARLENLPGDADSLMDVVGAFLAQRPLCSTSSTKEVSLIVQALLDTSRDAVDPGVIRYFRESFQVFLDDGEF